MEEAEKIQLRSDDVQDILTFVPHWIIRWGITTIFLTVIVGFVLSYFIKYPDALTATATITNFNPPINIISKSDGKLSLLLVENNQMVEPDQVLAVIENTCDYKDVLKLEEDVNKFSNQINLSDRVPGFAFDNNLKIGDLTTSYLAFLKSYKDLKLFYAINAQQKQISILNQELIHNKVLLSSYQKQESIYNQQFDLIQKDYERDTKLYQNKVISAREIEAKKKELLAAQNEQESRSMAVTNTKISINQLENSLLQLKIQSTEQSSKLTTDLIQNINNLKPQIEAWKQQYLLISPIKGTVSFFNVWAVNQNIKNGDNVFNIVPTQKQQLIAKLILPVLNSGKVKVGQDVNIKLNNYPSTEYGILKGTIKNISLVPKDNNYSIDVELKNGLKTSFNKQLIYKEEMTGTADIITENLSLLQRLFDKFYKIVNRS